MNTQLKDLEDRIEQAITAFTNGRASMHVPPQDTDVDIVLAECLKLVKGFEQPNHLIPDWLFSYEALGHRLQKAGWRDHADAQWDGVKEMVAEAAQVVLSEKGEDEKLSDVEVRVLAAWAARKNSPYGNRVRKLAAMYFELKAQPSEMDELAVLREYRTAIRNFNNSHGVETDSLEEAVEIERKAESRLETAEQACHDFYAGRKPAKFSRQDDPRSPAELSLAGCRCVRFGEGNPHWPCKLHPAVSAGGVDERAAFETWFDDFSLSVRMNGGQMNDTQMFAAWQARAALSAPSHGGQVPEEWRTLLSKLASGLEFVLKLAEGRVSIADEQVSKAWICEAHALLTTQLGTKA